MKEKVGEEIHMQMQSKIGTAGYQKQRVDLKSNQSEDRPPTKNNDSIDV